MDSLILRIAAKYLWPLLMIVSLIILYRGHNHPGGGFAGGLIASAGFILYYFAFGIQTAGRKYGPEPHGYITAGLILACGSGIFPVFLGKPFLTGQWISFHWPVLGEVHLGTPTVFDLGIYVLVIGVITMIISTLAEG